MSHIKCIKCEIGSRDASASEKSNIFPFLALIETVMVPQLLLSLLHTEDLKNETAGKRVKRKKALFLFMRWALSRASGPCHYGSVPALLISKPPKMAPI